MSDAEPGETASPDTELPSPVRRWTGGDQVIGSALVVFVVALFLPWYTSTTRLSRVSALGADIDGPRVHSYLWAALVLAAVGLLVLIGRDVIQRVPGNLPSISQMLAGVTVLALALSVLAVVSRPATVTVHPFGPQAPIGPETVSFAWNLGGFVAMAAALVALLAAFVTSGPLQEAERAAHAAGPPVG